VRLLLVFEADGKQQYVVGAETVVELPAQTKVDKPAAKGIDPVTVAAYEKLGATYGVLVRSDLHIVFTPGDAAAEKSLPAFRFEKEDPKAKLPDVSVPFGLQFASRSITDTGLKELLGLKNLSVLYLGGTQVTDAGLKELAGLKNLSVLYLNNTQVTNVGLKELLGLKNLSVLYLSDTRVTDAGLKELAGLKNLSTLWLSYTAVTDAGLKEIAGLKNLSVLNLNYTQVTDPGVAVLLKALPKCNIVYRAFR
jgi:Leucine-rich repeat (LRR) protein